MIYDFYIKIVEPFTGNIVYKIATFDEIVSFYQERYPDIAIEMLKRTPNVLAHAGYIKPVKSDCKICYYNDGCPKLGKINAHCLDYFKKNKAITFMKVSDVAR
jgi:restriction endonuclease S subunit